MRIGIITDSYFPTRDGVVTAVVTARQMLEEQGHTVFIIAPDPGAEAREEGVHYFKAKRFKKYPEYYLPIYRSHAKKLVRELELDIIHIYGITFMALKALGASHSTHVPTVMTYVTNVVDTLEYYSPIKLPGNTLEKLAWIYLKNVISRPNCVIALTKCTVDEFKEQNVKTKRIEIIPVGIDTKLFHRDYDGSVIRERHGFKDERVVIHVGRVSYEKNIDVVIKSVKYLDLDIKLMIVGRGPALDELKELVQTEGVSDRVIFTGFVPDEELQMHYAASDLVVSASKFETQGLTIVEAMACGIPAVCANGRAFKEIITDGYNGCLFEESPEDCAEAIKRCLDNKDILDKGIRETVEEFSTDNVCRKTVALYEEVIAAKAAELKR